MVLAPDLRKEPTHLLLGLYSTNFIRVGSRQVLHRQVERLMGSSIRRWVLVIASLLALAGLPWVAAPGDVTHRGALLGPSGDPLARPPVVEEAWLTRVQRGLTEKEYEATQNRVGLQAPNRVHDLRTYFDASGIRVHDRTAAGESRVAFALALERWSPWPHGAGGAGRRGERGGAGGDPASGRAGVVRELAKGS